MADKVRKTSQRNRLGKESISIDQPTTSANSFESSTAAAASKQSKKRKASLSTSINNSKELNSSSGNNSFSVHSSSKVASLVVNTKPSTSNKKSKKSDTTISNQDNSSASSSTTSISSLDQANKQAKSTSIGRSAKSKAIQAISKSLNTSGSSKRPKSSKIDTNKHEDSDSEKIDDKDPFELDLEEEQSDDESLLEPDRIDSTEDEEELEEEEEVEGEEQSKYSKKQARHTSKSSLSTRRNSSSISASNSSTKDQIEQEADSDSDNIEFEKYNTRLRRQSNSSSKSITAKLSADNLSPSFVVPSKKAKFSAQSSSLFFNFNQNSNATADKPTTSAKVINSNNSDELKQKSKSNPNEKSTESLVKSPHNKKETGGCISKPSTSSTLSGRRSHHHHSATNNTSTTNTTNYNQASTACTSSSISTASKRDTTTQPPHSTSIFDSSSLLFSKLKGKSLANKMSQEQTNPSNNTDTNAQPIPSSTTTASNVLGLATSAPAESADSSDNDTSEFNRITDLLQSRGLPSHIVNAFGSKVQQLIHRTMSSGITSRSQQLINSLQSNDESLKLTALTELCQLLVMGNEDTLVGFPIKQAVPLLLACMSSESENFDLMNHACRALTYMMDSLPRSSSIIAEGIGIFLDKLQVIQCMDVAEQALTSLEILSRKHSKQILNATQSGSISACLTYIDFFSIAAQRKALQITANCCQNMVKDEFVHIQSSLPILSQRLTHADKKSVESVCTVFSRLVENFQREPSIIKEIASHNVLTNMQQLLVLQPAIVSSSMFVTILHTIYLMCSNCNELSVQLLEHNIAETLTYLLVGSKAPGLAKSTNIDILSVRTPQELYEIVSIIGEIMPRLPHTGVFSIDEILRQTSITHQNEHVAWQWKDEHEVWRPYTAIDSRIIELAFIQEEDECVLNTMGRTYVLDFNSMLQINEETGTARQVARKVLANATNNNNSEAVANKNLTTTELDTSDVDHRLDCLAKKPAVYAEFVESLFPILYEVYSSSAGPSIKHRSLRTLLRIIYHSSSLRTRQKKNEKGEDELLLFNLLKNLPISSHIASMLASNDTKIIVSALQTAEILMQQLPDIFSVYFHREGVIYQIDKLIEAKSSSQAAKQLEPVEQQACPAEPNPQPQPQRKTRSSASSSNPNPETSKRGNKTRPQHPATSTTKPSTKPAATTSTIDSISETPEALSTTTPVSLTSSTAKYFRNILTKVQSSGTGDEQPAETPASSSSKSNLQTFSLMPSATGSYYSNLLSSQASNELGLLAAARRKTTSSSSNSARTSSSLNPVDHNLINESKEKVTAWILDQAKGFKQRYFASAQLKQSKESSKKEQQNTAGLDVLEKLKKSVLELDLERDNERYTSSLKQISNILHETDISSFEMIHSGLIERLLAFLSVYDSQTSANVSNLIDPSVFSALGVKPSYVADLNTVVSNEYKVLKCKQFLNVFSNLPLAYFGKKDEESTNESSYFGALVSKLHSCINQLEQFAVKVNDVPNSIGYGKSAIKFFNTHQIKCSLERHPSAETPAKSSPQTTQSTQLRQWKGGHVKVDPLAVVGTIEKYLLMRGIHKPAAAAPPSLISASFPTSSHHLAWLKAKSAPTTVAKPKSKSPSGLFGLKAAAERASDRFKLKKSSKESKKAAVKLEVSPAASSSSNSTVIGSATVEKKSKGRKTAKKAGAKSKASPKIDEQLEEEAEEEAEADTELQFNADVSDEQMLEAEEAASEILDESYDDQLVEDESDELNYDDEDVDEEDEIDDEEDEEEDEEEDDEDDIDTTMNALLRTNRSSTTSAAKSFFLSSFGASAASASTAYPKLELLINEHVLPSNMTIYQAIKQFSCPQASSAQPDDNDMDSSLLNNSIWSKVHAIHYRLASAPTPIPEKTETDQTKRATRTSGSGLACTSKPSPPAQPSKTNICADISSTLFFSTLSSKPSAPNELSDKSIDSISLLRLLNTLNRSWFLMYQDTHSSDSLLSKCLLNSSFLTSPSDFVNAKLTAKANRQLQDPLVIMTGHLPKWLPDLMQTSPFLFPFETRLMHFYMSSLDRDRAMQKLLDMSSDTAASSSQNDSNQNERIVPKLERKKKQIVRSGDLIKQAELILNDFCANSSATPAPNAAPASSASASSSTTSASSTTSSSSSSHKQPLLEIQYESEVGTGLGPTLEFYALISLEMQKCENEMWRGEKVKLGSVSGQNQEQLFYFSPSGLFPAPLSPYLNGKQSSKHQAQLNKIYAKFKLFGKFVAKAIMDFRVLDIQLSQTFYKWLIEPSSLCYEDIKHVDAQLYSSLEQLKDYLRKRRSLLLRKDLTGIAKELSELEKAVADLDLDFTLPGYSQIELKKGGKDTIVNLENLDEYLGLIVQWTLIKGVQAQFENFKEGFEAILPMNCLKQFYAEELERLFCGSGFNVWDSKMLIECTRCDHGYTHDSKAVQFLFEIMCSFSSDEQRQFLQFVTGSPRLPVGGLRSLVPRLTIVRKTIDSTSAGASSNSENYLPSVMTCVNYLKLPEYSSIEVMREKLTKAMKDGQLSFHLS